MTPHLNGTNGRWYERNYYQANVAIEKDYR